MRAQLDPKDCRPRWFSEHLKAEAKIGSTANAAVAVTAAWHTVSLQQVFGCYLWKGRDRNLLVIFLSNFC